MWPASHLTIMEIIQSQLGDEGRQSREDQSDDLALQGDPAPYFDPNGHEYLPQTASLQLATHRWLEQRGPSGGAIAAGGSHAGIPTGAMAPFADTLPQKVHVPGFTSFEEAEGRPSDLAALLMGRGAMQSQLSRAVAAATAMQPAAPATVPSSTPIAGLPTAKGLKGRGKGLRAPQEAHQTSEGRNVAHMNFSTSRGHNAGIANMEDHAMHYEENLPPYPKFPSGTLSTVTAPQRKGQKAKSVAQAEMAMLAASGFAGKSSSSAQPIAAKGAKNKAALEARASGRPELTHHEGAAAAAGLEAAHQHLPGTLPEGLARPKPPQPDSAQSQQRSALFSKTQLCRFHASGWCWNGADCKFAHCMNEVRTIPDLTKTSICHQWACRKCPLSAKQCRYAHGAWDLRDV